MVDEWKRGCEQITLLNARGWIVIHMADFNGDGHADILFRHIDGRVALWLMNGATLIGGAGLLEAARSKAVTQTADFNGETAKLTSFSAIPAAG